MVAADTTEDKKKPVKRKTEKMAPEIWSFKDIATDSTLDDQIKQRIQNELDRNFLVEAVPGSGKTWNLVQRMIALVLAGRPAEGIAAITFTRKAAEELRGRFREMMETRMADGNPDEKKLLKKGLIAIEDGYVGTIHGFCARILREFPVEAHLDPSFVEIEEGEEEAFFRKTWAELLSDSPELLKPFADHEVDPEEGQIISSLQRFCQFPDVDFSCSVTVPPPDPGPLLMAVVDGWRDVRVFDPRASMSETELNEQVDMVKHWRALEKLAIRLEKYYNSKSFTEDDIKDIWRAIRFLAKLNLYADGVGDNGTAALKCCNDRVNEECAAFREKYSNFIFPQLMPLLEKIREREREWRNQRGFVSYLDLLSRSVQLLKEFSHIRKAVQQRYPVLMIDEFQDTDPLQAEMAFLLAADDAGENNWLATRPRPGSLFLVGDPRQSVYRFRRADILIYKQAAAHLAAAGGEVITLRQNRRSLTGVCAWVNRAFEPAFISQNDMGQATFREMLPLRKGSGEPNVKAFQIPVSIRGNATRLMAAYDAEKFSEIIAGMLGKKFADIKDGLPLQPDDFLVLCRKNNSLVDYALWLEDKGIPVNLSGGGKTLAAALKVEFEPLYWLLRALTDCGESAIVWGVLVGPIFGFTDEEIHEYCKDGRRLSCAFPTEGDSVVARALNRLALFRKWMQDLAPGTAFRRIVSKLKFDAHLQGCDYGLLKTSFLGNVEKLFDHYLFSDAVATLGCWVQHWPAGQSIDEPGRVRLMTMHKAKGLEAPVVLMGIVARPSFREPSVMLCRNADAASTATVRGMLRLGFEFGYDSRAFAMSPGWKEACENEKLAEKAEKLRLDYVSCTRARDLLLISRHNNKSGGTLTPLSKEVEEAMNHCPACDMAEAVNEPAPTDLSTAAQVELEDWRNAGRAWREKCRGQYYLEESVTGRIEKAEKQFSKTSDGGRALGNLIHKILCNLLRWGVTAEPQHTVRIERLIDRDLGNDLAMQPKKKKIKMLISRVLSGHLWSEALQSPEAHSEIPVTVLENESQGLPFAVSDNKKPVFLSGTIDLIFRIPGGWKIVDYKTNKVDDEAHRQTLNQFYQPQLDLYARQWEKITGEKVLLKSLLYVRDGREISLD